MYTNSKTTQQGARIEATRHTYGTPCYLLAHGQPYTRQQIDNQQAQRHTCNTLSQQARQRHGIASHTQPLARDGTTRHDTKHICYNLQM